MTTRHTVGSRLAALLVPLFVIVAGVSSVQAATFNVLVDSPTAFRATFMGVDTDPDSVGGGNDFQVVEFKYWTVLVNLRGDSITGGNANGFYEIQLIHSGSVIADPTAPMINVSTVFTGLEPGDVLTDNKSNSAPHAGTPDTLTTVADITYDDVDNLVIYEGAIAGDADLDADGVKDIGDKGATDDLVKILNQVKNSGGITGREHGQAIADSRRRPGQVKKDDQ